MNNIVPFKRVSFAPSEQSVTSPFRPSTPTQNNKRRDWRNSDTLHPIVPANVARIRNQGLAANMPAPARTQLPAVQEQITSKKRRFAAVLGVLSCSVGVVAGLISIAALGPIGFAVAAGAGIVGYALIKFAGR